ncbi:MAG: PAS domain S-box protein, partial [Bacteroidales bacterium]|nr:PAS domain S-box protein [Bacteroidales bacterium]
YLENLVNYANVPIIVWDPQLCITRFNPAFEALTGLKEADVLKKSLKILFPPALADKSMELIQKTLSGERWETVEIEILHLDGSIRTVLWNSATLFEPDGKTPIATIAQGQDITIRKQAEKAKETQHALLKSLLNSPKDILIFSLDKNYCYTAFNENHREEMKSVWNADIKVGTNILDCMYLDEIRALAKNSMDCALNGEAISEIQHQPEPDIYYEFNWNPIWLNEEVEGVTVFIRDISERRKEEEKLKESLILLRIAEELVKIGGWSVTLGDKQVKWSDEVAAIHEAPSGYSPSLEEGMNFYAPEFRERISSVFADCAGKGIPYNEELQIITMKGKRVWIQSIGEAVRDENGNIYKIQGAFQNITERKKAEENLNALNLRQEAILSAVPDIIVEVNNAVKYTWANRAGEEFFGDDIIGKDASYYFEGEQETYDLVQPLFKGDENIVYIESWQRRKDGEKRLLAWWCRVLKDENGDVAGALSTARDITESKLSQEALQKSEERYRSLLTNLDAGIVVHTPDTSILMNNRRASELLGLSEEQMKGKMAVDPEWKFVNENKVPLPVEEYPVNQVAATRMPFGNEILGVIRPHVNDIVWLTVNGFPVFDPHGKLLEILISFIEITERKKAEEALRLKNLVFDASLAANSIADLNGNITEANDAFLRIWGYPEKNEVLGKPIVHFIHDPGNAVAIITALNEQGEWEGDYIAKRKNGTPFNAHGVATSLKDINGNLIGFQSAVIDITERKRAEEALRESEQKFRDTVTFLDEGYYSVTFDGVLLEHNQAFCRILGFDIAEDLRGFHLPDFWFHPGERKEYQDQLSANGIISNYQIKAKKKTGEIISVLLSSHLVKDSENQPLRIEGIFIDISERIRGEESLQRLTKRLQTLHQVDQAILQAVDSPESIVQTTMQYILNMLKCKRTSVGIFNFERKEVKVFAAAIDVDTIVQAEKILSEDLYGDLNLLHQNKMEIIEDLKELKQPSSITQILIDEGIQSSINVALNSAKGLYGALNIGWEGPRKFTAEDLEIAGEVAGEISIAIEQARLLEETRRYATELEERVLNRTAQLEASKNEMEAFSYSVSHDLRAPLRHISGFVDLLNKSLGVTLPEKEKHYLETISDSAHQMGMLIDDLLQFSRTGRQEMQQAELDMNIVLRDAMQLIHHDTKSHDIKWTIAHLPAIYGDFPLLRLVWFNLVNNAVKFSATQPKPHIEIGFTDENLEFVFFVRDNGVGFDMQYAHKLFGVFQRLHPSSEFEGTGIGLANVRRIILKHGGRTWAESGLNKGAVFYFSIPKQAKQEVKK